MDSDMNLKDMKKISISIPNILLELKPELDIIINKTDTIIKNLLEKQIYTCSITEFDKEKLNIIFSKNKEYIFEKI